MLRELVMVSFTLPGHSFSTLAVRRKLESREFNLKSFLPVASRKENFSVSLTQLVRLSLSGGCVGLASSHAGTYCIRDTYKDPLG